MLGFSPLPGTGKFSAALPAFSTVTVCGLSLLVEPITVGAKLRIGGSAKSSFNTRLLPPSAMYTLPFPATATPEGAFRALLGTVLSA
jgi:hypothetical protein